MTFLAGAFLSMVVIWAIITIPTVRTIILSTFLLFISIIVVLLIRENFQSERSKGLIKKSEVQLSDLSMINDYGGNKSITGTIKNLSINYTIKSISLIVKAYDCPDSNIISDKCNIIGEKSINAWAEVPPNQVRKLSEHVYFDNMPSYSHFIWSYDISEITAADK